MSNLASEPEADAEPPPSSNAMALGPAADRETGGDHGVSEIDRLTPLHPTRRPGRAELAPGNPPALVGLSSVERDDSSSGRRDERIQVLGVSPKPLVRHGLSLLGRHSFSIEMVAVTESVDKALLSVADSRPDVVVVDLPYRAVTVTDRDDLDRLVSRAFPVVVLAVPLPKVQVAQLIRLGVSGILSRDAELHSIQAAISSVHRGATVCDVDRIPGDTELAPPMPRLTERETQVLRLAVLGRTNKEIAFELHIGETTAKFHVTNLIRKCGVTRRIELAYWAGTRRFLLGGPPSR